MFVENLGFFLKTLRRRNKISQTDFCRVVGMSRNTLSKWENNHRTPSMENFKRALKHLGVSFKSFESFVGKKVNKKKMRRGRPKN